MSVQLSSYVSKPQIQSYGFYNPIPKIINNISKVALPAIALFAMASIQGSSAGPLAYGLCVEACFVATTWCPPLMPTCVFACVPLLSAPTP